MDRAFEDGDMRQLDCNAVLSAKKNRREHGEYDRQLHNQRCGVERVFRRILTRFGKFDVVFTSFIYFALLADSLMSGHTH